MRELSLFSGAGGGLLATKWLLGWETIGYVENDEYCQKVLKQRIADGWLDNEQIFSDIRAFISEGFAAAFAGQIDVVSAGVPCQAASVSGKRRGESDLRWLWPEAIRCVDAVRPRRGFLLENPPGILSIRDERGAPLLGRILGGLAKIGYYPQWDSLSSAELGAQHFRNRIWFIPAHSKYERRWMSRKGNNFRKSCAQASLARGNMLERATEKDAIEGHANFPKPLLFRDVDELAFGLDRLKAVGNGQDPIVAATAWEIMT